MEKYVFQNTLVDKKNLKEILSWTFKNYGGIHSSILANELKTLGFKYSTLAGISISIEDLQVPYKKNVIINNSNRKIFHYFFPTPQYSV